jgi:hypothetical protein
MEALLPHWQGRRSALFWRSCRPPMHTAVPLHRPEQFRWCFAPDAAQTARECLLAGRWVADATVLKQNRRRTVYRVAGTPGLIIKHDRPPRLWDWLKTGWRQPGQREYAAGRLAQARGLPVPTPVGYARRGGETLSVTLELAGTEKLRQAWLRAQVDPAWRGRLLLALATFARTFAAARVRHPDMHAGNILVADHGNAAACHLVDLVGARLLPAGAPFPLWDAVGWITQLASAIEPREVRALLAAAGVLPAGVDPLACWWDLVRQAGRSAAQRWPGRRVRLLQTSSLCEAVRTPAGLWRLLPPFRLESAQEALRQHDAQAAAAPSHAGQEPRTSRVTVGFNSFIVNEYQHQGWGLWRADRALWLNQYRLSPEGIRARRCHAWLQGPRRGILILEDTGGRTLYDATRAAPPADRRRLLTAAVRLLAALHTSGTLLRAGGAADFAVRSPGSGRGCVCLLSAAAARFDVDVRMADRAAALMQFYGSLPAEVRPREKLRLAVVYRRATGLDRARLRRLLAECKTRQPCISTR